MTDEIKRNVYLAMESYESLATDWNVEEMKDKFLQALYLYADMHDTDTETIKALQIALENAQKDIEDNDILSRVKVLDKYRTESEENRQRYLKLEKEIIKYDEENQAIKKLVKEKDRRIDLLYQSCYDCGNGNMEQENAELKAQINGLKEIEKNQEAAINELLKQRDVLFDGNAPAFENGTDGGKQDLS